MILDQDDADKRGLDRYKHGKVGKIKIDERRKEENIKMLTEEREIEVKEATSPFDDDE